MNATAAAADREKVSELINRQGQQQQQQQQAVFQPDDWQEPTRNLQNHTEKKPIVNTVIVVCSMTPPKPSVKTSGGI